MLRRGQIVKHIEESNVAGESWNRLLNILMAKIDVPIVRRRDATSLCDFSRIKIESKDRLPAGAFTQVKREQTKPATDIQDRFVRTPKQFVGRWINGIPPQFVPHITAQAELWKLSGDSRASRLMFVPIVSPVFHLRRIIALPD